MPDLITHTAAAYLAGRYFLTAHNRVLLYMGVILPDILVRPFYIIFPAVYPYTVGIHTPFFMIIAVALATELFAPGIRKAAFTYLSLGVFFHFILDLLQKHISSGYYWLFPFSWQSFEIGLFWPHQTLPLIPLWIMLVIALEFFIQKYQRKH
ncbi:MAG: hypothetical protein U5R06_10090 [candidate division KSB1 bacterium]|nr:hypothetical protein [candidate division KSB1 bacterium]